MRYNNMETNLHRKDAHMTKTAISPMSRHEGFTLIELLIVMVIMAILAVILVPTINAVIVLADNRRSQAFVLEVRNAADAFKGQNNGKYPGQDDIGLLTGTTPEAGPYTGSQILAARLFDYPDSDIAVAAPKATSKYLDYKSYLLIDRADAKNSLADNSTTINVLLYYPSRLNVTAPLDCYKWNDNKVYVGDTAPAEFDNYISDPRFGAGTARNKGGILIIGTGVNDKYMDADDIKSWEID